LRVRARRSVFAHAPSPVYNEGAAAQRFLPFCWEKVMMLPSTCAVLRFVAVFTAVGNVAWCATLRVPAEHDTIQAAIDAAAAGDTVLVAAGTYRERLRLKAGVVLRSAGDDDRGALGLKRAETTIIDGDGQGDAPGVLMAEGSTLDGFTITKVGVYDDKLWQKHHATQGNEQAHEHIGAPGTPGIAVTGVVRCTVANNIVHHIGYTGIAITGAEDKRVAPHIVRNFAYRNMGGGIGSMRESAAIIEENTCFENFYAGIGHSHASPTVTGNICYGNIRAGIGISEGSKPIVRGNKCYGNRRAGIGIRTGAATSPIVEENVCYQNDMAGIGCEEESTPIIRGNECYENALAGIGSRSGARPMIVGNKCYRNKAAGIGSEDGARPLIVDNQCYENDEAGIGQRGNAQTTLVGNHVHHNKAAGLGFDECEAGRASVLRNHVEDNAKVAIGVHSGWKLMIAENELSCSEGLPPLVMIFAGAAAEISGNHFRGTGVAAIRTAGVVRATANHFDAPALREAGPPQQAVWGLPGASIYFADNVVRRWRHGLFAQEATVIACNNRIADYGNVAMQIDRPAAPAIVTGNLFVSKRDERGVSISGEQNVVERNQIRSDDEDK
jgi:parallel beta-helix repeat protein